ncbi:hypothetical protein BKA83DRAFT_1795176 [Pisolithus microcarpus]|nr:hypothetical protein BKA83DRAFT_1795176 [Pisolithus microcarpus]
MPNDTLFHSDRHCTVLVSPSEQVPKSNPRSCRDIYSQVHIGMLVGLDNEQRAPSFPPYITVHSCSSNRGSKSRFLPRSPITRAIDEVDGESSSSGVVDGASSTLGDTTDCEAHDEDRRTPPPRSRWNLNTLLNRLRLRPNAHRDDTAVDLDDEAIGQISPSTSSVDEVPISQDDIVIACVSVAHS